MRITMLALILVLSGVFAQAQPGRATQVKPVPATAPAKTVFKEMDHQVGKLKDEVGKKSIETSATSAAITVQTTESKTAVQTAANAQIALSPATQTAQLRALLVRTEQNVETLKRLSEQKKKIPLEYAQSIAEFARQIKDIRGKPMISLQDAELLEAIDADLEIKKIHAQKRPEAAFDSINIIVHTKKNGQEIGVYQVWWVKDAHKDDPSKFLSFDRFSSPTNRKLPPGKYVMWTRATDGSQATGDKTPKEFGDGNAEVDTDLTAP